MSTNHRMRVVIAAIGVIVLTMACILPAAVPTETPTPGPAATHISGGGGNSGGAGEGGGSGDGGGGSGSSSGGSGDGNSEPATQPPPPPPDAKHYVVKQIETVGGEVISGFVCSPAQPFTVNSVTPQVAFTFLFAPRDGQGGTVTYQYSIPSAGESHEASGSYTLSQIKEDGTLEISLAVSDHVVFKGFDGNIPLHYKFDLEPSDTTGC